jgi:uncharacterized Zn-finger protein
MSDSESEIIINKKLRGRPKKYEEGCHQHCKDINYNLTYYHLNKKEVKCPICSKKTTTRLLKQHLKSKACQGISEALNKPRVEII